jgi:hypothetical protein
MLYQYIDEIEELYESEFMPIGAISLFLGLASILVFIVIKDSKLYEINSSLS